MSAKRILVQFMTIGSVLDMLRYDQCWPESEDDSAKLSKSAAGGRKMTAMDHVIVVRSYARHAPSTERWESHACRVLAVGRDVTATQARLAAREARKEAS